MQPLRFEAGLGVYALSVEHESVWISRGVGAHDFRLQLAIQTPQVGPEAGQLLWLETTLFCEEVSGPPARLGATSASVPFRPSGEMRRAEVHFLITNAQLLALEQRRTGDLRLQLSVNGYLPRASGFPGASEVIEYFAIAESRWRQQFIGLGSALGVDMLIPFPATSKVHRAVADFLREAQRHLSGNEIDSAMLQVRKALETIRASSWGWPGNKPKNERTADERWAWIRAALEEQASGAMHTDGGTKNHVLLDYSPRFADDR